MKSIKIQNFINDARERLKVLFDNNQHCVNIISEDHHILSQVSGYGRFLPAHRLPDTVELHNNTIYYLNSTIQSTELSELLKAESDYMFNMQVMLPDDLFSTLIYIQYEVEYFNFNFKFKSNRLYSTVNIHNYLRT